MYGRVKATRKSWWPFFFFCSFFLKKCKLDVTRERKREEETYLSGRIVFCGSSWQHTILCLVLFKIVMHFTYISLLFFYSCFFSLCSALSYVDDWRNTKNMKSRRKWKKKRNQWNTTVFHLVSISLNRDTYRVEEKISRNNNSSNSIHIRHT